MVAAVLKLCLPPLCRPRFARRRFDPAPPPVVGDVARWREVLPGYLQYDAAASVREEECEF